MSDIDVGTAQELFDLLHEALLQAEEQIVRQKSPELDSVAVLDLALEAAVARTQLAPNRETLDYLRWKVTIARANARANERVAAARAEGALAREQNARAFRDGAGKSWTVTEGAWRGGPGQELRCLVFSCDTAVRRVKNVPDDWGALTDAELSTLSWSR